MFNKKTSCVYRKISQDRYLQRYRYPVLKKYENTGRFFVE